MDDNLINQINKDLINDRIEEAAAKLLKAIKKEDTTLSQDIILAISRHKSNESAYQLGTIKYEDYSVINNQIKRKILSVLNEIQHKPPFQKDKPDFGSQENKKASKKSKLALIPLIIITLLAVIILLVINMLPFGKSSDPDKPAAFNFFSGMVKDGTDSISIKNARIIISTQLNSDTIFSDNNGSFSFKKPKAPSHFVKKITINHHLYKSFLLETIDLEKDTNQFTIYLEKKSKNLNTKRKATPNNRVIKPKEQKEIYLTGNVTNMAGIPIENANVSIIGKSFNTHTDASGNFRLPMKNTNLDNIRLQVLKDNYQPWNNYIQNSSEIIIIKLKSK